MPRAVSTFTIIHPKFVVMFCKTYNPLRDRYRIKEKIRQYASDFSDIGEVCVVVKWDPMKGDFKGYAPKLDEETGAPILDETGAAVTDETSPQFGGGFVFERAYGMNVLLHVGATTMRDSECYIIRKMVDKKLLQRRYKDDTDKLRYIDSASGEDYIVFDPSRGSYDKTKDQCLVREYYYQPGEEYPEGYFYITTSAGILEEGKLPGGIFPVIWAGWDEFQNSLRGRSWIKQARPYQAEINRAASSMAMQQITLGDDKVLYQAGTKLSTGALLPGVRGVTFQGAMPTILPGRDGSQYMTYVDSQIQEMNTVLMLPEEGEETPANLEPTALLYRDVKAKKKFSQYQEKFEQFLLDFWETTLQMARFYYDDEMIIHAAGKDEIINIDEFRQTTPLQYSIRLEPQEETADVLLGKYLTYTNILQYAGKNLERDDLGKLLSNMPFLNEKDTFSDFTVDHEVVTNDMLAMERGVPREPSPKVDPAYSSRKVTLRMRQPSFEFLPPEIQQLYQAYYQRCTELEAEALQAEQALKNEFIPVGGAMVACDIYIPNEEDPSKAPKRARIPYQAVDWLIQRLDQQGASLDKMETMNKGQMEDIAKMIMGNQAPTDEGQGDPMQMAM